MSKRISNAVEKFECSIKKKSKFQVVRLKQIIALVTHKSLKSNKAHDLVQHIE